MDRRYEDKRRLLKPRVLTYHGGQFEAVELWHLHVDQNDGDVSLQQMLQSLASRGRLDEHLPKLIQDDLVTQELGRLIIDQQDVDGVAFAHGVSWLNGEATSAR